MMPGELQLLVKENINFKNGTISGMGLKTEVRRATPVVLSEEAYFILQERVNGLADTDSVFYKNEKKFYKMYYKALEAAGVRKLTPYSCRHTTATILAVKKNIPVQAIKKMMRWSTEKMLNNYAHPDVEDARSAANAIRYNKTTEE
jgi:integrase